MHKMSVQAPPKLTVEKYLIEIAKYYNVDYMPDPQVNDEPYLNRPQITPIDSIYWNKYFASNLKIFL